ncbi:MULTISPECIES: GNAT family N-acetyltransferase [unclassified Cryobacterium]|uniref:GNAT family N-acetyltransferase n=1 Tax=unclassified Cryobacterium TaxID=2649013 RepID=UPI002AB448FF|nr:MULTISPECIES: GNAT family N-acetyltransferase [unclassified Cryobacterium]MDY7529244.1 GNAT family N-acetyltransferase [Cryobacterium sp. 10C2]MDY7558594.1 GNAT family N-acetyltransferase [Cryobacterium sp. 10C3]MEB0289723.1 GNAT family N-acetyltransferase [Cryobacterium sp. 10C2]MEB0304136.1 GNAT family N-acetyltransferase [Cryobacterium sp. 10I1]
MTNLDLAQDARLAFSPLTPDDLDSVFGVYSDPDTWLHLPVGRHNTREQSRRIVDDAIKSRREHDIGQWAVRVGDPGSDDALRAGTFIGTGGVNMTPALVWNLGYRLSPATWGRGFATEIALAAVAAVRAQNDSAAITARVLSNNPASARVAVRAGLRKVWAGPTTAAVAAGITGEIFSDRDLGGDALRWLIENV